MAILQETAQEISQHSFSKEIDQHAIGLIMDLTQKHQYQFPQRSAIREITSNAVDAVNERKVAMSILQGHSKVEDHYITRDGDLFRDSAFRPEYYNLNHLATDSVVRIRYYNNGPTQKDEIHISDNGVGLWGDRLKGYFKIGYSTKRNAKFALGKFGIGAKSALNVGHPFFSMITRYEGKQAKFNIYDYSVEPATPKFNMITGQENASVNFGTEEKPFMVYYEPTTGYNGIDIILYVKKHHKQQYIDAVKSQLLYFPEVRFEEVAVDGTVVHIPTLAKISYEDDALIISDNDFHNKPHLLIDKVNYGNINFQELELEDKNGNIGLKMSAEEVTVNPSRESVIWDDMTRDSIQTAFLRAVRSATERLEKELYQDDLLKWLSACHALSGGYRGQDLVLRALTKIVDMHAIDPRFQPNPKLRATFPFYEVLRGNRYSTFREKKGSKTLIKLDKSDWISTEAIINWPVYTISQNELKSVRKNKFMASHLHPGGFVLLEIPKLRAESEEGWGKYHTAYKDTMLAVIVGQMYRKDTKDPDVKRHRVREAIELVDYVLDYFCSEERGYPRYADVQVPEDFRVSEQEDEADEEVEEVEDEAAGTMTHERVDYAKLRKQEGKVLVHVPNFAGAEEDSNWGMGHLPQRKVENGTLRAVFSLTPIEFPIANFDESRVDELYYATKDTEPLLHMAQYIVRATSSTYECMVSKLNQQFMHNTDVEKYSTLKEFLQYHPEYEMWKDILISTHQSSGIAAGRDFTNTYFARNNYTLCIGHPEVQLCMVAQSAEKYMRDFKHIRQFFMDVKNGVVTMSNVLRDWNTGRLLQENLDKLAFLEHWGKINPAIHYKYTRIKEKAGKYTAFIKSPRFGMEDADKKQLMDYMKAVTEFQFFVNEHSDNPELIAAAAKELLNPAEGVEIRDARAVNMTLYKEYEQLLDWVTPVQEMFNYLCDEAFQDLNFEPELRNYARSKGADILFTYQNDDSDDHS